LTDHVALLGCVLAFTVQVGVLALPEHVAFPSCVLALAVHVVALALGDHVVALALGDHVVALALDDHAVALELGELNLDWMRMDDELLSLVVLISFKQLMAFKPFLLGSLHL